MCSDRIWVKCQSEVRTRRTRNCVDAVTACKTSASPHARSVSSLGTRPGGPAHSGTIQVKPSSAGLSGSLFTKSPRRARLGNWRLCSFTLDFDDHMNYDCVTTPMDKICAAVWAKPYINPTPHLVVKCLTVYKAYKKNYIKNKRKQSYYILSSLD